jgi:hypothetical protein
VSKADLTVQSQSGKINKANQENIHFEEWQVLNRNRRGGYELPRQGSGFQSKQMIWKVFSEKGPSILVTQEDP